MKKNYLIKKIAKKSHAKKAPSRETKIAHILRLVREIGEYASENLCVEDAQMEELELVLRNYIK